MCLSAGCVSGDGRGRERGRRVKQLSVHTPAHKPSPFFYIKRCAWYHEEHLHAVMISPDEPELGHFLGLGISQTGADHDQQIPVCLLNAALNASCVSCNKKIVVEG